MPHDHLPRRPPTTEHLPTLTDGYDIKHTIPDLYTASSSLDNTYTPVPIPSLLQAITPLSIIDTSSQATSLPLPTPTSPGAIPTNVPVLPDMTAFEPLLQAEVNSTAMVTDRETTVLPPVTIPNSLCDLTHDLSPTPVPPDTAPLHGDSYSPLPEPAAMDTDSTLHLSGAPILSPNEGSHTPNTENPTSSPCNDFGSASCLFTDSVMSQDDAASQPNSTILPLSTAAPSEEMVEDLSANSQYDGPTPEWPWTSIHKDNALIDELNFYILSYLVPDYSIQLRDRSTDVKLLARKEICRKYFAEPTFKQNFNFLLLKYLAGTSSSPKSFKYAGDKLSLSDLIDARDTRPSLLTSEPALKSPRTIPDRVSTSMDLASHHPSETAPPPPPTDLFFPWTDDKRDMLLIDHLNSTFLALCYPTLTTHLLHDNVDAATAARREFILKYKNDASFRHTINDAAEEYAYTDKAATTPVTSYRVLPSDRPTHSPIPSRPDLTDITLNQTTYETSFTHDRTTYKIQCHFTDDTIALIIQHINAGAPLLDIANTVVRTTPTLSFGFGPARQQSFQHHTCPKFSGSYYTTHGQIEGLHHDDRSVLLVTRRSEAGSLHSPTNRQWTLQWLDRTCDELFTAHTQALYDAHLAARNWIDANSTNLDEFTLDPTSTLPPLAIFTADIIAATIHHFPPEPPIAYFISQPNAMRVKLFCGTGLTTNAGSNYTLAQLQSILQHYIVRVNPVERNHQYSFHSKAICSDLIFENAITKLALNIRGYLAAIPQLHSGIQQQGSGSVHSLRQSLSTRSFSATHVVIGSLSSLLFDTDEASRLALLRTIKSLFSDMKLGPTPSNLQEQLLAPQLNQHSFHICDTFDNPTHRYLVIVLQLRAPIITAWNDAVRVAGVHRALLKRNSEYGTTCSELSWPLPPSEKGKDPKIMYAGTLIPAAIAQIACSARPVMATRNLFTHVTLDPHVRAANTYVQSMTDFPTMTIGIPLFDTVTVSGGSTTTQKRFATYGTLSFVQTETPEQTLALQRLLQLPTADQMRVKDDPNPLRIKRLNDCYLVDVAPHANAFQNQPLPPKVAEMRPSVKALRFCSCPTSWTPTELLDMLLSQFPGFPTSQIRDIIVIEKGYFLVILHWNTDTTVIPTTSNFTLSYDVLPHLPHYINSVHPFNHISKKTIVLPRPPVTDRVGYTRKLTSHERKQTVSEATPSAPPIRGPPSTTLPPLPQQGTSTKE